MDLQQAESAGIGITVDSEGDAIVLVVIQTENEQYAAPLPPEIALAFGRGMRAMAREAQKLQDELEDLDPEEIQDRLVAIQNRIASPDN